MTFSKRGQIEVTFNWIYMVIAGAVILLFFFGLVVKQKQVSEERLSGDVVQVMSSILAGAGVSEKTKNFIDASGLADYTLYFSCDAGVSEFGIKDRPARTQNNIDPIFAPREIQTSRIVTWSLPYALPFKVTDFLFVIPSNVKYYILGNDADFVNEFLDATEGIERESLLNLHDIQVEANQEVRLIDTDGSSVPGSGVPALLQSFDDQKVSAVVFIAKNQADFYQKQGTTWRRLNKDAIRVISLGGERDAAKYAAIFSADDQLYQCNMQKAFKRLEFLTEIYGGKELALAEAGGKLQALITYYQAVPGSECKGYLGDYDLNALEALARLHSTTTACQQLAEHCLDLVDAAQKLKDANANLRIYCTPLY
ncbi:hypothetical protein HYU08_01175 [Candidatus Woesearchaeota archaeon]|nr:hypothetical protein [Candidatus Woesearchaeota archaeon]